MEAANREEPIEGGANQMEEEAGRVCADEQLRVEGEVTADESPKVKEVASQLEVLQQQAELILLASGGVNRSQVEPQKLFNEPSSSLVRVSTSEPLSKNVNISKDGSRSVKQSC
ncbi:uncharacterized protein LOC111643264 [Copidosoma floridanum]|uniref:uncharacterized protein LOC111643264 n=1 Tax=Copidosoma floridanum TaxID=29053 RepID=UPI000C6F54C5|nr:uncharacterized protein LOC111643264 [Copidosoma floridanum]